MRSFRRLPPFLRVVTVIGPLFAGGLLLLWLNINIPQGYFGRSEIIGVTTSLLGFACSAVVVVYIARLHQPGRRRRIPLDSWQKSQARAVAFAVMAGPALCGLLLALVTALSPTVAVDSNVVFVVIIAQAFWPPIVVMLLSQV